MPKVYNKKTDIYPADAVYIGRPGRFGNPFRIGLDGTREECIKLFEDFVKNNIALRADIKMNLRGKDLVCFCAPLSCHGDVILKIANE